MRWIVSLAHDLTPAIAKQIDEAPRLAIAHPLASMAVAFVRRMAKATLGEPS